MSRRVPVAVLLVGWIVLTGLLFVYPRTKSPGRVDAVVVFAGGRGERLEAARALMEDGVAPTLVVSNGRAARWTEANRLCERQVAYEVLCPAPDPQTTIGEARMVGALAAERGWSSLALVTSTYHGPRARLQLARCFPGRLTVVAARPEPAARAWQHALREQVGYLEAMLRSRAC